MSKTEKEFPEKRDKPFKMREPTEELNPRLIANIDPDALYYQGDLDQAQQALKNFVSSNLPDKIDYDMFSKLFRLSQLAIEYYSQEQEREQAEIEESRQEFQKLKEEHSKLNEFKQKHALKKQEYKEQLSVLENKMKEMNEESQKIGAYKCLYCSKCYREHDALDAHLKRRHLDLIEKLIDKKDMRRAQIEEALKRSPEEQLKEQNRLQMKKMRELQEMIVERSKPSEVKLVEQVSKKLQSDLDLKLSILTNQSQVRESQSRVIQKKDEEIQVTLNQHKADAQMNNKDGEQEEDNNQKRTVQKEETEAEKQMKESMLKMNQNIELFNKAFQSIQQSQEKLSKQQEEYSKQLGQIVEGQEQLKKSQLALSILNNNNNGKQNYQNNFQGNMVSMKSAPFIASSSSKIDGEHAFPLQPVITAQFQNNPMKYESKRSLEIREEKPKSQRKIVDNKSEKELEKGNQIQEIKQELTEVQNNIHMPKLEMVLNADQDGIREVDISKQQGKRAKVEENNGKDDQIFVGRRNSNNNMINQKIEDKIEDEQLGVVVHSRRSSRKSSKGAQSNKQLEGGANEQKQIQDVKITKEDQHQGQENKLDKNNNISHSNEESKGGSEETSILYYPGGNPSLEDKNRFLEEQNKQSHLNQPQQGDGLQNETVVQGTSITTENKKDQVISSSHSLRSRKDSKNNEKNTSHKEIAGVQTVLVEEEQKQQQAEERTEVFGSLQRQDRVDIAIDWQSMNMDNMQRVNTEEESYNHGMLDNEMALLLVGNESQGNSELKAENNEIVQKKMNDEQDKGQRRLSQGIKEDQIKGSEKKIEQIIENVKIENDKQKTEEKEEQRKGSEKIIEKVQLGQENKNENSGSKDQQMMPIAQILDSKEEQTKIVLPQKAEDQQTIAQQIIGNQMVGSVRNNEDPKEVNEKLATSDNQDKHGSKEEEEEENKQGNKQEEQFGRNQKEETQLDIKAGWMGSKKEAEEQKTEESQNVLNIEWKQEGKEKAIFNDQIDQGKIRVENDKMILETNQKQRENMEKEEEDKIDKEDVILQKNQDKEDEIQKQLESEDKLKDLKNMEKQRKEFEEKEVQLMQQLEKQMVEEEHAQKIHMEEQQELERQSNQRVQQQQIKEIQQLATQPSAAGASNLLQKQQVWQQEWTIPVSQEIEQQKIIEIINETSTTKQLHENNDRHTSIPSDTNKVDNVKSNVDNASHRLIHKEDSFLHEEKAEAKKLNGVFEEIEDDF